MRFVPADRTYSASGNCENCLCVYVLDDLYVDDYDDNLDLDDDDNLDNNDNGDDDNLSKPPACLLCSNICLTRPPPPLMFGNIDNDNDSNMNNDNDNDNNDKNDKDIIIFEKVVCSI